MKRIFKIFAGIVACVVLFSDVNAAEKECKEIPDCLNLGYVSNASCREGTWVACPFDINFKKCVNASCEQMGFTADDKSRWCEEEVPCPSDRNYTLCASEGTCVEQDEYLTGAEFCDVGTYIATTFEPECRENRDNGNRYECASCEGGKTTVTTNSQSCDTCNEDAGFYAPDDIPTGAGYDEVDGCYKATGCADGYTSDTSDTCYTYGDTPYEVNVNGEVITCTYIVPEVCEEGCYYSSTDKTCTPNECIEEDGCYDDGCPEGAVCDKDERGNDHPTGCADGWVNDMTSYNTVFTSSRQSPFYANGELKTCHFIDGCNEDNGYIPASDERIQYVTTDPDEEGLSFLGVSCRKVTGCNTSVAVREDDMYEYDWMIDYELVASFEIDDGIYCWRPTGCKDSYIDISNQNLNEACYNDTSNCSSSDNRDVCGDIYHGITNIATAADLMCAYCGRNLTCEDLICQCDNWECDSFEVFYRGEENNFAASRYVYTTTESSGNLAIPGFSGCYCDMSDQCPEGTYSLSKATSGLSWYQRMLSGYTYTETASYYCYIDVPTCSTNGVLYSSDGECESEIIEGNYVTGYELTGVTHSGALSKCTTCIDSGGDLASEMTCIYVESCTNLYCYLPSNGASQQVGYVMTERLSNGTLSCPSNSVTYNTTALSLCDMNSGYSGNILWNESTGTCGANTTIVSVCDEDNQEYSSCPTGTTCEPLENGCYEPTGCAIGWLGVPGGDGPFGYESTGQNSVPFVVGPDIWVCYEVTGCDHDAGFYEECPDAERDDSYFLSGDLLEDSLAYTCRPCECRMYLSPSEEDICDEGREFTCTTNEIGCAHVECNENNTIEDVVIPEIGPEKISTYYKLGTPHVVQNVKCYDYPTECNSDNGWMNSCGSLDVVDEIPGNVDFPHCYKCECPEHDWDSDCEDEEHFTCPRESNGCYTGILCNRSGGYVSLDDANEDYTEFFEFSSVPDAVSQTGLECYAPTGCNINNGWYEEYAVYPSIGSEFASYYLSSTMSDEETIGDLTCYSVDDCNYNNGWRSSCTTLALDTVLVPTGPSSTKTCSRCATTCEEYNSQYLTEMQANILMPKIYVDGIGDCYDGTNSKPFEETNFANSYVFTHTLDNSTLLCGANQAKSIYTNKNPAGVNGCSQSAIEKQTEITECVYTDSSTGVEYYGYWTTNTGSDLYSLYEGILRNTQHPYVCCNTAENYGDTWWYVGSYQGDALNYPCTLFSCPICSNFEETSCNDNEIRQACENHPEAFACTQDEAGCYQAECNIHNGYIDITQNSTGFKLHGTPISASAFLTCDKVKGCDADNDWLATSTPCNGCSDIITGTQNLGTYLTCYHWEFPSCHALTGDMGAAESHGSNVACLSEQTFTGHPDTTHSDEKICYSDCYTCQELWDLGEIDTDNFESCYYDYDDGDYSCTNSYQTGSLLLANSEITTEISTNYDCYDSTTYTNPTTHDSLVCTACKYGECSSSEIPLEDGYTCPKGQARQARPDLSCCKKCCRLDDNPAFGLWAKYDSNGCAIGYNTGCTRPSCSGNSSECLDLWNAYEYCLANQQSLYQYYQNILDNCEPAPLVHPDCPGYYSLRITPCNLNSTKMYNSSCKASNGVTYYGGSCVTMPSITLGAHFRHREGLIFGPHPTRVTINTTLSNASGLSLSYETVLHPTRSPYSFEKLSGEPETHYLTTIDNRSYTFTTAENWENTYSNQVYGTVYLMSVGVTYTGTDGTTHDICYQRKDVYNGDNPTPTACWAKNAQKEEGSFDCTRIKDQLTGYYETPLCSLTISLPRSGVKDLKVEPYYSYMMSD